MKISRSNFIIEMTPDGLRELAFVIQRDLFSSVKKYEESEVDISKIDFFATEYRRLAWLKNISEALSDPDLYKSTIQYINHTLYNFKL